MLKIAQLIAMVDSTLRANNRTVISSFGINLEVSVERKSMSFVLILIFAFNSKAFETPFREIQCRRLNENVTRLCVFDLRQSQLRRNLTNLEKKETTKMQD